MLNIYFLCRLSILLLMQGLTSLLNTTDNDGRILFKIFVKVSDNTHTKVLASVLFSSSLIEKTEKLAGHHIFVIETIANCIIKKPTLLYRKINFLTSFSSSRHDHIFLIFCI